MDPLTAAFNALAAFNNFLCTPPGQKLAEANVELIVKLLNKIEGKITPNGTTIQPVG